VWAGKQCYLGSTVLFRLADRLTRRPNHFATESDLLRDVWDGDKKTPSTIRSSIRYLKLRLQEAGMDDLAAAIQCEDGMYALLLGQ
jgi:DNA-binding response OmpR family regulator